EKRQKTDAERKEKHRQTIANRRQALDKKRTPSHDIASHERPVTQNVNESIHQDKLKKQAVQQKQTTRPVTKKDHMKQTKLQQQLSSPNKKEHLISADNPNQPIKKGTRTLNEERSRSDRKSTRLNSS